MARARPISRAEQATTLSPAAPAPPAALPTELTVAALFGATLAVLHVARARWLEVWLGDTSLGTTYAPAITLACLTAGCLLGGQIAPSGTRQIAFACLAAAALTLTCAQLASQIGVVASLLPLVALGAAMPAMLQNAAQHAPGASVVALGAGAAATLAFAETFLLPRAGTRLTLDAAALGSIVTAGVAASLRPEMPATGTQQLGSRSSLATAVAGVGIAATIVTALRVLDLALPSARWVRSLRLAVACGLVAIGALLAAWLEPRLRASHSRSVACAAVLALATLLVELALPRAHGAVHPTTLAALAAVPLVAAGASFATLLTAMRRSMTRAPARALATLTGGGAIGAALAIMVAPAMGAFGTMVPRGVIASAARDQVLALHHTPRHTIAVVNDGDTHDVTLFLDAAEIGGSGARHRYLEVLGHLALALGRRTDRVLILDLGDGAAARAVARHQPASLTVVEPWRAMREVSSWFTASGKMIEAPITLADARRFLLGTTASYDAIVSGAPPLRPMHVARLLTTDCHRLVKARLASGGVFVTALPPQLEPEVLSLLLRSFASEFANGLLFLVDDMLLAVGFADPLPHVAHEQIAQRLRACDPGSPYVTSAEALLAACVGAVAEIGSQLPAARIMDDAHVLLPAANSAEQAFAWYAANLKALQAGHPAERLSALLGGANPPDLAPFLASRALLLEGRALALIDALESARTGKAVASRAPSLYREALRKNPRDRLAAERLGITAPTLATLRAAVSGDAKDALRDWTLAFPDEFTQRCDELLAMVATGAIDGAESDLLVERLPRDVNSLLRAQLGASPGPVARALTHAMTPKEYQELVQATQTENVLIALLEAAGERRTAPLIEAVLALLDHGSPDVRTHAAVALNRIAGETFDYDPSHPETATRAMDRARAWLAKQR